MTDSIEHKRTIRSFVNGTTIGKFRDNSGEDFDLVMRYDYEKQFKLDDFDKISVKSVNGRFIPLKQLSVYHLLAGR